MSTDDPLRFWRGCLVALAIEAAALWVLAVLYAFVGSVAGR